MGAFEEEIIDCEGDQEEGADWKIDTEEFISKEDSAVEAKYKNFGKERTRCNKDY